MNGALVGREDGRLICLPMGLRLEEYEIPEGVRTLDPNAFSGDGTLVTVALPAASA